jgi:dienelactone hydrolase
MTPGGDGSRAEFLKRIKDGGVDPSKQESREGTYRGRDAMGLFWSMRPERNADDTRRGQATFRKEGVEPDRVKFTVDAAGSSIASGELTRRWLMAGTEMREVREEGLVGRLFVPPGRGPHRAVMVLGGSGGGYDVDKAAVLSRHGFATLALAYFGAPPLPQWLHRVPVEYFERALAWLGRQPEIDARRIGVLGVSRGSELALILSSMFPQIGAVVAYAPSAISWGSGGKDKATGEIIPCWTWRNRPLPFAPLPLKAFMWRSAVPVAALRKPVKFRNLFRAALRNRKAARDAEIPVERANGPILLISGGDDHVWPAADMAERIAARLRANRFTHEAEHTHYPKAGHELRYPFLPTTVRASRSAAMKFPILLGGTAEADAEAQREAWRRAIAFLGKAL